MRLMFNSNLRFPFPSFFFLDRYLFFSWMLLSCFLLWIPTSGLLFFIFTIFIGSRVMNQLTNIQPSLLLKKNLDPIISLGASFTYLMYCSGSNELLLFISQGSGCNQLSHCFGYHELILLSRKWLSNVIKKNFLIQ